MPYSGCEACRKIGEICWANLPKGITLEAGYFLRNKTFVLDRISIMETTEDMEKYTSSLEEQTTRFTTTGIPLDTARQAPQHILFAAAYLSEGIKLLSQVDDTFDLEIVSSKS